MERIRNLNRYPKVLLLALVVMAVVFASVYAVVISREGFLYHDQILIPGTEGGNTVYTATVRGEEWCFTVTPEKTVTFRCGDKHYGPYTAKEDPTAIPADNEMAAAMTGVEIREGDRILFRGGIFDREPYWLIVSEDGSYGVNTSTNGMNTDHDPMEPSVIAILHLMNGPKLSHKGHGIVYAVGLFISLIAAVYILFADELFRLHFIFRARDPDLIEPSDWELTARPIAWTILVVMALIAYLMGL